MRWPAPRQQRIEALLWDERAGLYFDYDFETGQPPPLPVRDDVLAAWAGLAAARAGAPRARQPAASSSGRAASVTSTHVTGAQWDAPFGWAPLQLFAVRGCAAAVFAADADSPGPRLPVDAGRRLRTSGHARREVRRRAPQLRSSLATLRFGYTSNEVGFGWTNGVALELLAGLGL